MIYSTCLASSSRVARVYTRYTPFHTHSLFSLHVLVPCYQSIACLVPSHRSQSYAERCGHLKISTESSGPAASPPQRKYDSKMTSERKDEEPTFTATFYPGGQDSFMMPELISPAPQRYVVIHFQVLPGAANDSYCTWCHSAAHRALSLDRGLDVLPEVKSYG